MPTVETNGVRTYYERRGSGPPIVFVHGMFMNTTQWAPQVDALADEFTVVTYDVRGHGRTGGSDRETYDFECYAVDLEGLLDALALEQPILCGLSMGGCIAQVYGATHPAAVAGLVLADTFPTGPLPLAARLLFANLRAIGRMDRVVRYTTLNEIQLWFGDLLTPGVSGDRESTQRILETEPTIPHREVVKIAESMAAFPDTDLDYASIDVPTLVMHGEHLPSVIRDLHPRLAARLTNAEVRTAVVPDAGHASNVDNPAYFTEQVRAFAESLAAGSQSST